MSANVLGVTRKKPSSRFARFYGMYVMGVSPNPPRQTPDELYDDLAADDAAYAATAKPEENARADFLTNKEKQQASYDTLEFSFNDLTGLLKEGFLKLIGLLTMFGFIFGIALANAGIASTTGLIIAIGVCVALALLVWGLAPRLKVVHMPDDVGYDATKMGMHLKTRHYGLYRWHWHRYLTWRAIEVLQVWVTTIGLLTLVALAINFVIRVLP